MIEITDKNALAINAAEKVLLAFGLPDPGRWLRHIDPLGEDRHEVRIEVLFWMNKDPKKPMTVVVNIGHTEDGWLPMFAALRIPVPHERETLILWDFDEQGNNPRKR